MSIGKRQACFTPVDPGCLRVELSVDAPDFFLVPQARRAASWLVKNERARLKKRRAMHFHASFGAKVPSWFKLAVWALSLSPKWNVLRARRDDGAQLWRMEWKG